MVEWKNVIAVAINLFILMDSIGNVPAFLVILKEISPRRQRFIIFRELIIALFLIILFYFLGDYFLNFMGITQDAVMMSGGIILLLIAIKLVFPVGNHLADIPREKEPFIVPLAVPFVAGPAVLAGVMIYSHQQSTGTMLVSIFLAWAVSMPILLASSYLKKILGSRGLTACERLMGLLLTLLAVQMFLGGLRLYIHSCVRP